MNYIKNNKVFIFLFLMLVIIISFLFLRLVNNDTENKYDNIFENSSHSKTTIAFFSGGFSAENKKINLSWNVPVSDKKIEKIELWKNDVKIADVSNKTSIQLPIKEYDISTGNQKFDLKVTLDDQNVLEKSQYIYIDEAFDFKVSQKIQENKIIYNLTYYFDDRKPVGSPTMEILQFDQPVNAQFISTNEVSRDEHYVFMNCIYEMDYTNIDAGTYIVNIDWVFNNYNLKFGTTSNLNVTKKVNE